MVLLCYHMSRCGCNAQSLPTEARAIFRASAIGEPADCNDVLACVVNLLLVGCCERAASVMCLVDTPSTLQMCLRAQAFDRGRSGRTGSALDIVLWSDVGVSLFDIRLSAMNVWARASMKGAAKCNMHCELQISANQQNPERALLFRFLSEDCPLQRQVSSRDRRPAIVVALMQNCSHLRRKFEFGQLSFHMRRAYERREVGQGDLLNLSI